MAYFGSIGGYIGGGIRGMGVLGDKPFTVKLELNEWFRFDKPGTYRLAVTSRRLTDESVTPHAVVPVESNTLSFEILPRDATWEASQLEGARRIIDGCRMIRFLGIEAAAFEMIRRYGADTNQGCDRRRHCRDEQAHGVRRLAGPVDQGTLGDARITA